MKTWQAASAGLGIGIAATMGIGAIGHTEQPVGPYFQVTSQEIVNTSHIQTAIFCGWWRRHRTRRRGG